MARTALLALVALLALSQTAAAIIGGERADRADYPYFAVVGDGCGGALVAPSRVVTAAHCLESVVNEMSVRVGPEGVRRKIVRRATHPRYVRWQRTAQREFPPGPADLMLLGLARPVRGVEPLPLAGGEPPAGTAVITIGRGATAADGSGQGAFRAAEVQVQDPSTCADQLPDRAGVRWSLCTRDPRSLDPDAPGPFNSACMGDSGGPLIGGGALVGVVSWGPACGTERDPEIYADAVEGRAFILGRRPAWAPQAIGRPRVAGRAVPGRTVVCRTRWRVRPTTASYDFLVDGRLRRTSSSPRYRVRKADSHKSLSCTAGGRTRGGATGTPLSREVRVAAAPRTPL